MAGRSRGPRGGRRGKRVVAFSDIENGLELVLPEKEVNGGAGRAMASQLRKRLKKGVDANGDPIPGPNRGKKSGALIKSIKYDARKSIIFAKGNHPSNGVENAKLLAVQQFGLEATKRQENLSTGETRKGGNWMGVTKNLIQAGVQGAEKQINKALQKGKAAIRAKRGAASSLSSVGTQSSFAKRAADQIQIGRNRR